MRYRHLRLTLSLVAVLTSAILAQGVFDGGPGIGKITWEWAKPSEAPQRDTWVLTEAEAKYGCSVSLTVFNHHLVEVRCPAPFSPYGVTWYRYCVVKPDERFERAKIIVARRGKPVDHDLMECEVSKRP